MRVKTFNTPSFKTTAIGQLNRRIEKSVSGVVSGEKEATGRAISFAKEREKLLIIRHGTKKKIPA